MLLYIHLGLIFSSILLCKVSYNRFVEALKLSFFIRFLDDPTTWENIDETAAVSSITTKSSFSWTSSYIASFPYTSSMFRINIFIVFIRVYICLGVMSFVSLLSTFNDTSYDLLSTSNWVSFHSHCNWTNNTEYLLFINVKAFVTL